MTVARPPTSCTAACQSSIFSSSLRVGDSPVVPQTTTPSEPSSTSCAHSSRNFSTLTFPSAWNGVTIAVRISPSKARTLTGKGQLPGAVGLEVLAQGQFLVLVRGADSFPVHEIGRLQHPLEAELADALGVLDHERDVA